MDYECPPLIHMENKMEPLTTSYVINLILIGIMAFTGWVLRNKWTKIEDHSERITVMETRLDVLGDINETLHTLRTDVEVIKSRTEHYRQQ